MLSLNSYAKPRCKALVKPREHLDPGQIPPVGGQDCGDSLSEAPFQGLLPGREVTPLHGEL